MISNKYINSIIVFFTSIAFLFTTSIYVKSQNLSSTTSSSLNNFTYIDTVLNKEKVTEIDIEISEDNWSYLLENAINEEYVNANITVNGVKYYNVGIRAKGNSSLSMIANDPTTNRYSFKVKFDEYVDGQTLDGLSKISLNNIMCDTTYMKEYLSYDLLERMGVPTPAFAFTNIKINGEEWGLYFGVEVIEEEFIERNYGVLAGNLYKPEGNEIGNMENKEKPKDFTSPNMENIEFPENFTPPDDNMSPPNIENSQNTTTTPPVMNDNTQNSENFTPPTNEAENNSENLRPPTDNSQNYNNESLPNIPEANKEDINNTPPDMRNKEGESTEAIPNNNNNNNSNVNDNSNLEPPTNQESNNFNKDEFQGGFAKNGMTANNGANLVYTDDNKESYSDILDNNVFKTTTDSDEDKVIEMIKALNEGINLEEYLNVDEILRYFAVNTFLVNLDSYASNMKHNYYLYENDGVFEIIPWDYNLSFGGFTIGNASSAINFPIDSPVTDSLENSPLISKLLEVDEYKETYHKYLEEIVNYVNSGVYEDTILNVNSLISSYVKIDSTAFYTYEEYEASLPELINFGIDRAKSISAQLDGSQPSTTYGNIETTVDLTALGIQGGMDNKNIKLMPSN